MVVDRGGGVRGGALKTPRPDGKNTRPKGRGPLPLQKPRQLHHVATVEEVGSDERVKVAVENFLHVAAFDFGAMVFD
jgi:hypothetical protein